MLTIVGQVLNERYEVLEKIGEGGMAVAYRGRDRILGRVVAIKVMRPELAADSAFLARFRREARAAAGVTHEHIASIYDTGNDRHFHYIVMEYVEGESLKERLRREGPLPLDEALRIAAEAAEALEAAHAVGVVHRDIKPHNILLGRDGTAKVTDFGLARAASFPGHQDTGAIVGSVHYLSPEQARGDAVGPQGDVYSLGATLFEMLTGRPPFTDGDRLAVLHKHIYDRPAHPSELRPGLPAEVDSVVAHCLEKDLSKRFASAREVVRYLAACPRSEAAGVGPWRRRLPLGRLGSSAASAAAWVRQRAVWIALVAVVLIGVVNGLSYWAAARARTEMVAVVDVVGMSASGARQVLTQSGLRYREAGSSSSEKVSAGRVLSQDPAAGLDAATGTVVKVVLSSGPSHIIVPNVTQMSLPQARRNIEDVGLMGGVAQEAHDEAVPAGYVAGTLPAAGAEVVRGTTVDLIVSLGPEPLAATAPSTTAPPAAGSAREERLSYVVPADATADGEVLVAVDVTDDDGTRRLYEGRHRPGDRIPAQRIRVVGATTARILVDGEVKATRHYRP
jgi:serine/threonine-protein kinase